MVNKAKAIEVSAFGPEHSYNMPDLGGKACANNVGQDLGCGFLAGAAACHLAAGVAICTTIPVAIPLIVGLCEGFASSNFSLQLGEMYPSTLTTLRSSRSSRFRARHRQLIYYFATEDDVNRAKQKFVSTRLIWKLVPGRTMEIERWGM